MEKNGEIKHVVISGASRGLGAAISRYLLESGYSVSGFSRSSSYQVEEMCNDFGDRYFFKNVDISRPEELKIFIEECREKLGSVYGVINNAAVVQQGILATLPEVEVAKMITVNLDGAIRLARLCLRDMIQAGAGRVVNISSIVGSRGYNGLTVYSATKAGLDGFTRGLAREVGRRKVTVNSIAPGYMKTDMSAGLNENQLGMIERRTPLGRLATLEDILPLVQFLLSDGAGFITAQTILVDGGLSN